MSCNSFFAFLALVIYVATLIPSNITKVFPHTRRWETNRFLLKKRRLLGLTAFSLSIDHVIISLTKYNISLFHLKTYSIYYTGVSIFSIFTVLALTSNNWSIKKLKHKWKILHQLTYIAMFLLLWHILSLMDDNWTVFTPIALNLMSFVSLMYLTRLIFTAAIAIKKKLNVTKQPVQLLSEASPQKTVKREEIEVS